MSRQSDIAKPIGVIDMNSIYANEAMPFKFGYTDKMPATLDQVVSPHDDKLLLQYWPPVFMFEPVEINCTRDRYKQFVSGPRKWTKVDIERHDDMISHERVVGRRADPDRRLYALLSVESVLYIDDLAEQMMTNGKGQEKMAFDFVINCRDILCGTADGLDDTFVSLYKDRFPEDYEACRYVANDFNVRFIQGCRDTLSPKMMKVLSDAYYRSYNSLIEEYEFWQAAKSSKQHASVEKFIEIKNGSSFFSAIQMINYFDTDIDYINFDHPILTLSSLVNQASNDLYSYPKEQEAGLNPFNMIQKAIMADKMTLKEALVVNIQRRNEYMKALEISYSVLQGAAKTAAVAPLSLMAPWEKYFSEVRRYGWTKL